MSDSCKMFLGICNKMLLTPTIADMHSPHSDFDIGYCAVIHCDDGGVSLVEQ